MDVWANKMRDGNGRFVKGHKAYPIAKEIRSKRMRGQGNPMCGMSGEKSPAWKGGSFLKNGYRLIYVGNNKYELEHRVIASRALGRPLRRGECVHHIDGNTVSNRNSNLLVCTQKYHMKLERKMAYLYKQEKFGRILQ